ncbi:serine hydroxymethyltransferase [Methanosphaera sp. WGK6]|uniref:serine hydroxymethyltransferase n=1 Tax=Methanosphaera sp. WGK6 TaxID=1561964 RepID=UPI00084C2613|nr:serine hydroxymethyltransferase [Methanosphaera sp. WGK6]OED30007.1 serine hydroxymethyltransferase [Methanosphaera sp. WGK6]
MSNLEQAQEIKNLTKQHHDWMKNSLNLIASENITSRAVREAMASDLSHRYAEGLPGERLYEGCIYIDEIEQRTIELSEKLFGADHANVQSTSGVVANLASFFAVSKPGDLLMSINVPEGGHISHANVSAAGVRGLKTSSLPMDTELMNVDLDKAQAKIRDKQPTTIVLGGSLFLFPHPVKEISEVAQEVGARVIYDGAHVLGLIAGKQFQDPVKEGADIVTGSTHKTFPGPQGGIILCKEELHKKIDNCVFPGLVSNHHLHHMAGLGIATAEMLEFGEAYAKQTIKNAKALAQSLYELGFNVLCEEQGFTESHQVAMDVSELGDVSEMAKTLQNNNIILNKNLLPWDDVNNSSNPSGIRMGSQELTHRGFKEDDMTQVAEFIKQVVMDGKDVTEDVTDFMQNFTKVHYSFDEGAEGYDYIEF